MRIGENETTNFTRLISNTEDRPADGNLPAGVQTAKTQGPSSSWPFDAADVTPLEWWRTMPADHLGDVQLIHLRDTMQKIGVMKDHQWLSALQGNAAASIAIAIGALPIDQITLEVDLAMSALTLCALEGSAGAALVLAHILRRTPLEHPFGKDIVVSWLAHNLFHALNTENHATKPHLRSKTSGAFRHRQTSPFPPVPA